ncbi:bifunctional 4-hydroxy-2-oxoglutarate aldolase/2-dehydro-3-deoxy-phosphogluconate aldolase [Ferviditalea candida]|uniref:Bifunctional 4-hydroxy-2-oxoglutarate aldolase/2-dehydro-3-deoxy-phosphogluconate aldolase n=1 Tax=Ferviditalea candida TaxID=3108399 RepID=A0ABU5ZMY1_9BACL|nr:bifunctional 4-hydroxy-2-oxoglutarate aldolase/2-dehydro-3-deoxy-phosphogluconate aldolase [Paenibacillaceae bacterium T2]
MNNVMQTILQHKLIAIIRSDSITDIENIVAALHDAGIKAVEVTMNTPDALKAIELLSRKYRSSDLLIGAGTVLEGTTARLAILSGASFLLSPTLDQSLIETANRYQVPVIPGVFTPTEVLRAFEWGAQAVKIFPASTVGPRYIKELKAPLSHVNMIPVGGVNLDNVKDYLQAGSFAVGVGSSLVSASLVKQKDFEEIRLRASAFVNLIDGMKNTD